MHIHSGVRTVAAVPAIALLAGSAFGLLLSVDVRLPVEEGLAVAVCVAVWAWWRSWRVAFVCALAAGFAAGGALLAIAAWQEAWRPGLRVVFDQLGRAARAEAVAAGRVVPEDDEAFAVVRGVLTSDAATTDTGVSLGVEVSDVELGPGRLRPASGGIAVTVGGALAPGREAEWRTGRHVRLPVQLRRPPRYLDPGVADNERALARRGTTLVGTVKSGALVEVTANGRWWQEASAATRRFARRAIATAVGRWSSRSAAIVSAIVIGDRVGLDPAVQRRLQEAGTYHVIAISGGNIAILVALLLGAFRLAGVLGRTAMLASIAGLVAYGYLVSGGASVDRATLMAAVYCGGRALDHRSPPLNTLWIAAATLVVWSPLSVADPAFVLTFGATFAILATAGRLDLSMLTAIGARGGSSARLTALLKTLGGMFAASLAAEAMLFPVGAMVFSRVTFAGLALNFLAIPMMAVAQIAGMLVVPLALVSMRLAAAAGWVAHAGAAGLVWSAELVRFAPRVTYRVAAPGWPAVIAYYGSLVSVWMLTRWLRGAGNRTHGHMHRLRIAAAATAVAAAIWMLAEPWAWWRAQGDGRLHLTFIDVGQGDSLYVRFPRGRTMVVDTGGLSLSSAFDIGDRVVAPVLRANGVGRLDYLVLTHGDPDHIGGAPAIVREFRPREVWEGIPVPRSSPLTVLRAQTQALGAKWANVYSGDRIAVDGVEVMARHPEPADWERQRVRNDDSLVLELRWRQLSVLLTGDIGKAAERTLAVGRDAPIRVLKVPHHGSLTSSSPDFLGTYSPQVAVASAGRTNHFGHPAPPVLRRYRDIGAEIFRTDQDGAVTLETDGDSVDVRTMSGRRLTLAPSPAPTRDRAR